MLVELRFIFTAHCLEMLNICTNFHENIFKVSELFQILKGHNLEKTEGGVTALVLCTLSDHAL